MTSRERVEKAINHQIPDFVPVDIGGSANGITLSAMKLLKDHFGITSGEIEFYPREAGGRYNEELVEKLGGDFKHAFLVPPASYELKLVNDEFVDEWGLQKRIVDGAAQQYGYPLRDAVIEDLDSYPWPNPYDETRAAGLRERIRRIYEDSDYALSARAVSHGFFELSWELRSMDVFFVDMMIDKEFANALLDRVLEIQIGMYDLLLGEVGEYLQVVQTADDYGTQRGPMLSPELLREMIMPRRRKLNDFIKKKAPHVKISHHTCGSVYAYMEDLIGCGIDILNPVQPLAEDMDSFRLKREYGDRLCFHGSVDEQIALVGPLAGLEEEIKTRMKAFAPGGGFIIAPTSNFQDDMPLENILNFVPLARKYGVPEFYQP